MSFVTSFPNAFVAKPAAQKKRQQQKRVKVVKVSASSPSSSSELDDDGSNQALLSRRGFSVSLTVLAASFHSQNENVSHARNSSLPTVLVIGSTGQTGKLVVASFANANDANVSRHLPPLAAPNASERNALNALVADYLDRRGYRATLLTLRDEADSFSLIMKDSADERFSVPADGLRRAVHRASRLDARDAAHDALSERASAASRASLSEPPASVASRLCPLASRSGRAASRRCREKRWFHVCGTRGRVSPNLT